MNIWCSLWALEDMKYHEMIRVYWEYTKNINVGFLKIHMAVQQLW